MIALIGGIIGGVALDNVVKGAIWPESSGLYVMNIPNNIGVGKITNVTFVTYNNSGTVGDVNITLDGAASARGRTDKNGMLVLSANVTSNDSINVVGEKPGHRNATSVIRTTPGLDISVSPSSITSGTATFVTLSAYSMGAPVDVASVNLSGAGVAIDGVTTSNGQIVMSVNATNTGPITASIRKAGYADGSATVVSTARQILSISSSHSTLAVNVPVYVTFLVTAGGSGVNDARINLSGAVTGSGITNQDGKAIILVTPQTTGTITATASATGYAGSSTTITSSNTQSLSLAVNPTTVTAGVPAYVEFTSLNGNNAIGEVNITLSGVAGGNGITNQNGHVILQVNATGTGTITASASKPGYSSASLTFAAIGQPTLGVSASPSTVTNGVPTYVVFTVTSGGSAISGATVSVSGGGINADSMTNSAGQATMLLNAAGTGTINVVVRKSGYVDGLMTIAR
ncbi:MAG: hypothetical protein FIB08_04095 [Candidatus Methanoperedens sp.]|nr:hypothetical protein [Candidatus Methanoperedens sp.]